MKKKVNIFGKKISVFVIALLAVVLVSAALIPYFGRITGMATVSQGLLVDGKSMPGSGEIEDVYGDFTSLEEKTFVNRHYLENQATVPASVSLVVNQQPEDTSGSKSVEGITTSYTSTITESGSYDDYFAESQNLVSLEISGKTLTELLSLDLEYTVNVISDASDGTNDAPNINIKITDEGVIKTVENWGGYVNLGTNTRNWEDLMTDVSGAVTVIDESLARESFATTDALKTAYGNWQVVSVEVRAQAGAAGGQKIRPVKFVANGVTMDIPDSDTYTSLTIQPGEMLNFYINNHFSKMLVPDTYTITTTVLPAE
ncbi:MAG TPA: hypothetical protein VMX17_14680 [Candidatus Glassbacteria bacterium]|nr:hypothetical protein [Candidatus Glassbacteria bacterium]